MKRCSLTIFTILVMCLMGGAVVAQQQVIVTSHKMVVGGYYANGFALMGGDGYEDMSLEWQRSDRTAKFSIGGGAYFDFFFTQYFGVEAGMGFLNKGIRFKEDNVRLKYSFVYMEIPIMAKLDYKHIQVSLGFAFSVALTGRTFAKIGNSSSKENWSGGDWDYYHRVNIGPKIAAGYAIPVGPIFIVPGMSWTMNLVNDINNKRIEDDTGLNTDYRARANNLMFTVAVEWQLPG